MSNTLIVVKLALAGLSVGCAAQAGPTPGRELKAGSTAPDFTLPSSTGGDVSLSSLRGKTVVLYFYPKDQTPGCTRQACDLRDANAELEMLGVVVLGISRDSLESHRKFKEKHALNFPLLSDPDGRVHDLYGAFKPKSLFGRTALGVDRSTFLVGPDGAIRRVWRDVTVTGHAAEVLAAVKAG